MIIVTLINIFTSPIDAFSTIKTSPRILIPLFLVLAANLGVYAWYFTIVDYPWLIDAMIEKMGNISTERLTATKDIYHKMGASGFAATTLIGTAVFLPIMFLLQAGYFTLISSLLGSNNANITFKHWYSLAIWTWMTSLAVVLVMAINIVLASNNQITFYEINSLAFSNIGFSSNNNSSLGSLYEALNIPLIWSLGLLILAYKHWTQSSWATASIITLAPHVLIYGGWAVFALI